MPFKMIGTVIILVLLSLFTGFNIDNRCNVWLFHTFENVPVFITILVSFLAGLVVMIPFMFGRRRITDKDIAAFEQRKKNAEDKIAKQVEKLEKRKPKSDEKKPNSKKSAFNKSPEPKE
jgi:uncharacterized integral membrane protein